MFAPCFVQKQNIGKSDKNCKIERDSENKDEMRRMHMARKNVDESIQREDIDRCA